MQLMIGSITSMIVRAFHERLYLEGFRNQIYRRIDNRGVVLDTHAPFVWLRAANGRSLDRGRCWDSGIYFDLHDRSGITVTGITVPVY